jgi:hypothetical protein
MIIPTEVRFGKLEPVGREQIKKQKICDLLSPENLGKSVNLAGVGMGLARLAAEEFEERFPDIQKAEKEIARDQLMLVGMSVGMLFARGENGWRASVPIFEDGKLACLNQHVGLAAFEIARAGKIEACNEDFSAINESLWEIYSTNNNPIGRDFEFMHKVSDRQPDLLDRRFSNNGGGPASSLRDFVSKNRELIEPLSDIGFARCKASLLAAEGTLLYADSLRSSIKGYNGLVRLLTQVDPKTLVKYATENTGESFSTERVIVFQALAAHLAWTISGVVGEGLLKGYFNRLDFKNKTEVSTYQGMVESIKAKGNKEELNSCAYNYIFQLVSFLRNNDPEVGRREVKIL